MASVEDLVPDLKREICACKAGGCTLRSEAKCPVPPEGNPRSKVWIIGRNPGEEEDALHRQFIGKAGECLDRMLSMSGIKREDLWITSLCKCASKEDRPPYPGDVKACFTWLEFEYQLLQPKVICLLGNQVVRTFFPNALSVVQLHGEVRLGTPLLDHWKSIFVMMHHPGYVARKGRKFEAEVAGDWVKLKELISELDKQTASEAFNV